jgi:hypothetical protein
MEEKILVSISSGDALPDDTLYIMDPDGNGQARLFDFHGQPMHQTGGIWQLRIASDRRSIYFCSDHGYIHTPASSNLFRIAADGNRCEQLTPGPNSGRWNQPGPYGTVEGIVTQPNGEPLGNSTVCLEGVGLTYSDPDGSFRFEDVPEGVRWIVAYKPGDTPCDSLAISVAAGVTHTVNLTPYSDYRMSFERPILHRERLYHVLGPHELRWIQPGDSTPTIVYTATGSGVGIPAVGGFDVAPSSGRLVIVDYLEGCPTNRGLYLADGDGKDLRLLVDMKADFNWCGAGEVFWSPDETRLALKGCYNWQTGLMVFDLASGSFLGWIYFDKRYTLYNVELHGWSPHGEWLLCSYWLEQPGATVLSKVKVDAAGSPDPSTATNLLSGVAVSGATWGMLGES